jgi:diguanylate cyclase (GGDEF)-like protein
MSLQPYSRNLFTLPSALVIWIIFASLALILVDPGTMVLSMALIAFTATLSLTSLFRYANWTAAVLSILIFTGVQIALKGAASTVLLPSAMLAAAVLVVALVGGWIAGEVRRAYRQLANDQKLIDELRLYDPASGILRYRYVYQTLRSEVLRSQRYDKRLCVLLMEVADNESLRQELGADGLEKARRQVVELLPTSLRAMDIAFSGDKLGAILPETNLEGAQKVVDRLVERVQRKLRLPISIGVAQFPTDGVTEDELMRAAEAALRVSQSTGQTYIQYTQLQQTTTPRPAT